MQTLMRTFVLMMSLSILPFAAEAGECLKLGSSGYELQGRRNDVDTYLSEDRKNIAAVKCWTVGESLAETAFTLEKSGIEVKRIATDLIEYEVRSRGVQAFSWIHFGGKVVQVSLITASSKENDLRRAAEIMRSLLLKRATSGSESDSRRQGKLF